MRFNTSVEAMNYAGKAYISSNTVTYMGYSKYSIELLNKTNNHRRKIEDPNILYDGDFYYIKHNEPFNIWEQGIRIVLSEKEMISKYPYQYWSIMFQESLKDSDNWIFKEKLNKEQVEAREHLFNMFSKIFIKI